MDEFRRGLMRGFAHRKWAAEIEIKRLADVKSWAPERPGWREYAEPDLVAHYDAMKMMTMSVLSGHASKENHPALAAFADEVAIFATKGMAFGEGNDPPWDEWRDIWEEQFRDAINAVSKLSRILKNMRADERDHWIPPRWVAKQAGAGDDVELQRDRLEKWLEMTHAVAEYFDLRTEMAEGSRGNVKTADHLTLGGGVWMLAGFWVDHFDEMPGTSQYSPFVAMVQEYVTRQFPESTRPTHPNIAEAVRRIRPRLEERLHRKKSES